MWEREYAMKLTGRRLLFFCVALIMSCAGALCAGIVLGAGLSRGLAAIFAAVAIIGSISISKILKSVPDVGIIIKYKFPKDAGYYQKGERKTSPVSDSDILYQIKTFLPFVQIGIFVLAVVLFNNTPQSNYTSRPVAFIRFDGGIAELLIIKHSAAGPYAKLNIYSSEAEHIESISMRTYNTIPSIDSIVAKNVYISYRNFPANDSILSLDMVLLGESLLNHNSLMHKYHFKNIK